MTATQAVVARVATVAGLVRITVHGLAIMAAVGVAALVVAGGLVGGWSGETLLLAAALGGLAAVAPVVLARFGAALAPVRDLPTIRPEDLKAMAGTLGSSLASGERKFLDARGLGRVTSLGSALWDLRKDVDTLKEGGLAPAAALAEVLIPTRLIRVGVSALAAPFLLAIGLLALVVALVLA